MGGSLALVVRRRRRRRTLTTTLTTYPGSIRTRATATAMMVTAEAKPRASRSASAAGIGASIRLARAEREGRRPTTGIAGSPRLLQGSLLDYMPNICAPPAGSGWLSPAGALAVACTLTNRRRSHGVSSNEVVCHASWWHAAVLIAPWALLAHEPSPGMHYTLSWPCVVVSDRCSAAARRGYCAIAAGGGEPRT